MTDDIPIDSLPDRIVVGANGAYWRDYGDHYSMAVVSSDNDPIVPVAVYVRAENPPADDNHPEGPMFHIGDRLTIEGEAFVIAADPPGDWYLDHPKGADPMTDVQTTAKVISSRDLSEMLDAETALARRYAHAPSRVQMVAALAKARDEDLARLTEDNGVTKADHLVAGTTWAKAMEVAATAAEPDKENR